MSPAGLKGNVSQIAISRPKFLKSDALLLQTASGGSFPLAITLLVAKLQVIEIKGI